MPNDRAKFERGVALRATFIDNDAISAPKNVGKIAIFCSLLRLRDEEKFGEYAKKQNVKEIKTYRKEALKLAELALQQGRTADIVWRPTDVDFKRVLTDPYYSDIITIGHGTLSSYFYETKKSSKENSLIEYDWYEAIIDADHLKTGTFIQRHCGGTSRHLPVPLGGLLLADVRQLFAPVGITNFDPRGLSHPDNTHIIQVFQDETKLSYENIKSLSAPSR